MIIENEVFKGHTLIVFKRTPDDKFPFKMGVKKCLVVLENLDAIEAFVTENKGELEQKPEATPE